MTENNAAQAVQESERNAAVEEYFGHRTWIKPTASNFQLFEAGFDRAYALLSKLRAPVADERAAFSRAEISFPMTVPENRVYLAGPMTGHENHNFPAFHAAAERLRGSGLEVVNPADHGLVSGLGWSDYMRWDLVKLAGCHAVYVLPGWEKSKGASLEVSIARALGMPVFTVAGAALASAPVANQVESHQINSPEFEGIKSAPVGGEAMERIEQMAVARYRAVPCGQFSHKVIAGDGSRSLHVGPKDECLEVAAHLTEAFLDGAFVASSAAPQASEAVPNEPLRVFSAGMWTYDGTGQAFSHTELDEAAFVTYRAALSAQPGAQQPDGGDMWKPQTPQQIAADMRSFARSEGFDWPDPDSAQPGAQKERSDA